jgi:alpha-tubulin suppressor-like RCC1 family protein
MATGCFYTVVLNEDGRLFSSGNNSNGCLSQGTRVHERLFVSIEAARKITSFATIKAGLQHWLALDEDCRLWGCWSNFHGQLGLGQETLETLCLSLVPLLTLGGQRVHSLSVRLAYSIICTSSGRIFATGCNTEGQLGTGDFTRRSEFVAVHGGSDAKLQCLFWV